MNSGKRRPALPHTVSRQACIRACGHHTTNSTVRVRYSNLPTPPRYNPTPHRCSRILTTGQATTCMIYPAEWHGGKQQAQRQGFPIRGPDSSVAELSAPNPIHVAGYRAAHQKGAAPHPFFKQPPVLFTITRCLNHNSQAHANVNAQSGLNRTKYRNQCRKSRSSTIRADPNYLRYFWDNLSKIWLTKRALRELDRRNTRAAPNPPRSPYRRVRRPVTRNSLAESKRNRQPTQDTAADHIRCCDPRTLKDVKL
jgi:hypothetical protein